MQKTTCLGVGRIKEISSVLKTDLGPSCYIWRRGAARSASCTHSWPRAGLRCIGWDRHDLRGVVASVDVNRCHRWSSAAVELAMSPLVSARRVVCFRGSTQGMENVIVVVQSSSRPVVISRALPGRSQRRLLLIRATSGLPSQVDPARPCEHEAVHQSGSRTA